MFLECVVHCGPLWTTVDHCGPLWTAVDHCGPSEYKSFSTYVPAAVTET